VRYWIITFKETSIDNAVKQRAILSWRIC